MKEVTPVDLASVRTCHSRSNSVLSHMTEGLEDFAYLADGDESPAPLSDRLAHQPWHEIGFGPPPISAVDDHCATVDHLSAILSAKLYDLQIYRMVMRNMRSNLTGGCSTPKPCPGGRTSPLDYLEFDISVGDYVLKRSLSETMREFVSQIGHLYNDVGFHSFWHAAHVTISMNKLLSMVTTSEDLSIAPSRRGTCLSNLSSHRDSVDTTASETSNYDRQRAERQTFSISEDPRIQFAMIFSALIHDVGHEGVPNSVLVDEEYELAILHNDVSVAEQTSLQVAFTILQREEFRNLKQAIGPDREEWKVFRKTVINSVMATDISDQERVQIVSSRWKEAFPPSYKREHLIQEAKVSREYKLALERRRYSMLETGAAIADFVKERNTLRRLGIRHSMDLSGMFLDAYPQDHQLQQHAVLDAMMQASDVAHTLQSFKVFVKWNRRLFKELYEAHLAKRIGFDPSENWYQGQISFFTHIIVPLAEKLDKCGIFGATGTVFKYFAEENRRRWAAEGEAISLDIIAEVKEEIEGDRVERNLNGKDRPELKRSVKNDRKDEDEKERLEKSNGNDETKRERMEDSGGKT